MTYIYGQLVTETEKKFLTMVLTEKTKFEQVKHLKAIQRTAARNNTSLIDAALIFENNKKSIDILNKNPNKIHKYDVDKDGEVCIVKYDNQGNSFKRKLTDTEKDELSGKKTSKPKDKFPFLKNVKNKIKNFFVYISEILSVY